jgi:hypothetical protein
MENTNSANIPIRTLYTPGFSSLAMSYFKTNLIFSFAPYIGKDDQELDKYCKKSFLSTSVNPDRAAFFYVQASRIIDGKNPEEQIEAVLPCYNGTTLTFAYKPNENNQMVAYLVINKNNEMISFKFQTTEYADNIDGQMVTKIVQTGLITFHLILGCYLAGSAVSSSYFPELYNEALEKAQEQEREETAV